MYIFQICENASLLDHCKPASHFQNFCCTSPNLLNFSWQENGDIYNQPSFLWLHQTQCEPYNIYCHQLQCLNTVTVSILITVLLTLYKYFYSPLGDSCVLTTSWQCLAATFISRSRLVKFQSMLFKSNNKT